MKAGMNTYYHLSLLGYTNVPTKLVYSNKLNLKVKKVNYYWCIRVMKTINKKANTALVSCRHIKSRESLAQWCILCWMIRVCTRQISQSFSPFRKRNNQIFSSLLNSNHIILCYAGICLTHVTESIRDAIRWTSHVHTNDFLKEWND